MPTLNKSAAADANQVRTMLTLCVQYGKLKIKLTVPVILITTLLITLL